MTRAPSVLSLTSLIIRRRVRLETYAGRLPWPSGRLPSTLTKGGAVETAHVSDPASAVTGGSYGAPYSAASGACSGVLFRPEDFSLWRVEGELGEGAALEWGTAHG